MNCDYFYIKNQLNYHRKCDIIIINNELEKSYGKGQKAQKT